MHQSNEAFAGQIDYVSGRATPAGMLDDAQLPIAIEKPPRAITVFDAAVTPETMPLLGSPSDY